ncbi:hypothetical protein Tco_1130434 [Tanacetum coccineum]
MIVSIEESRHGPSDAMHNPSQPFEFISKETYIDKDENHILGPSTIAIAKKFKEPIQKDKLTLADLEGTGLERLKVQYNNDLELEYHVSQLKAAVLSEAQWNSDEGDISAQKRSILLPSLSIMLLDTTKKVLRIGSLKDEAKKFVAITLKLLMVQDKLHHLLLEFVKDFNNAFFMFIRRTVIKNRVEDIQLGVESYQRTLNLTKPTIFFKGIDQRIPFTMTTTHKGVVYLNQYNIKSLMKLSEVKKFSDGTLVKIQENLIDILSKNKLGSGNKRLKGREWTDYDVKSLKEMLKKIDEILWHREQLRRLEEYVGRRPKTINHRTFVRPL